jgi:ankyrin repeat protein
MAEYILGFRDLKGSHGDGLVCTDGDPDVLLRSSAEYGHHEAVQEAIDLLADINSKNELTGMTALMLASLGGHNKCVALLLKYGAEVNHQCVNGNTAAMLACYRGHQKIIKMLRNHAVRADGRPVRENFGGAKKKGMHELPLGAKLALERELENDHGNNARELGRHAGFIDAARLA